MFNINNKYDVLTNLGWSTFLGIHKKISDNINEIIFKNGKSIFATDDHIFFINGKNIRVSDLKSGDILDSYSGNHEWTIVSILRKNTYSEVFDLVQVEKNNKYLIYSDIITSNCDELAFLKPSVAEEFWTAMRPTLSTGGDCIITSTPNNDEDLFAKIWFAANETFDEYGNEFENGLGKNGFKAQKVSWRSHPERDEKWASVERVNLGEMKFLREMECEFVSGDETLIDGITLERLTGVDEIFSIDNIRWYSEPVANHIYVIGYDPAMGHSENSDYAAMQVIDITTMTQIAEWRHNTSPIPVQINILHKILSYIYYTMSDDPYQHGEPEIYWTFESNGIGEAATISYQNFGEEKFPGFLVNEPRTSKVINKRKGLFTSNRSKTTACSTLKNMLETNKLKLYSKPLIKELKNFVGNGLTFNAKPGETDDLISALLLAIRVLSIIRYWNPDINDRINDSIVEDDNKDSGIDGDYSDPLPIVI